jgi:hypothetical protein
MSRTTSLLTKMAIALALAGGGAAAAQIRPAGAGLEKAGWTLVTASEDTWVYMRLAEGAGPGPRRVWTAYDSDGVRSHDGFNFRSVKSLGEFDCRRNLSRVVEETYHEAPGLTGRSWQSPKFIPTPWAAPQAGSVGAIRMAYACRTLTDT